MIKDKQHKRIINGSYSILEKGLFFNCPISNKTGKKNPSPLQRLIPI